MNINPKETVEGVLLKDMRVFFKRTSMSTRHFAQHFKITKATATLILENLMARGYLEAPESEENQWWWEPTSLGRRFGLASAAKPYKRSTIDQTLENFLINVNRINNDSHYKIRIKKAVVFGSYLSDQPTLGDLDIGVLLEHKAKTDDERRRDCKIKNEEAIKKGMRHFYYWIEEEVWKGLKNRSPVLSLHNLAEEKDLIENVNHRVIFPS